MDLNFNTSSNPFENGGTPGGEPESQEKGRPGRIDSFDAIFKEPNKQDVPANSNEGFNNWTEDPFAGHEAFPEPSPQTTPGNTFGDINFGDQQ